MAEVPSSDKIKLGKNLNLQVEFEIPTFEQWKEKVEKDLKGASYDKKLITKTYEGIDLQPIYTRENINSLSLENSLPGFDNFLRGSFQNGYFTKSWDVNQEINIAGVDDFNSAIHHALKNGQNCVNLNLDTATKLGLDADYADTEMIGDTGLSISGIKNLERALKDVDFTKFPLKTNAGLNLLPFLSLIYAHFQSTNFDSKKLSGSITVDPLAQLSTYGNLPVSLEFLFDQIKIGLDWTNKNSSKLKILEISSLPYANAGANAVQELAFSMSTAVYYINELLKREVDIENIINKIQFSFGISTNYFIEIAKFRAARVLWSNVIKAFGLNSENLHIYINGKSSEYYHTNSDPYVNLLRATTETFSAIVGGAESITTSTFDESFRISDDFSRRIARNTQTILREESHLNQVIDPAGGSYYIETLTEEISQKSWELFQQIEENGGMLESLKNNFIQDSIHKVSVKREQDSNKRKNVIVGSNMFVDINEEKLEERKLDKEKFQKKRVEYLQKYRLNGSKDKHESILKKLNLISDLTEENIIETMSTAFINGATLGEIRATLTSTQNESIKINKISPSRISQNFEELRQMSLRYKDKNGFLPTVYLANLGILQDYKARADFSTGFFEVGGFEIINSQGFLSIDDAVEGSINSDSSIVVICSTDEKYSEIVPEFTQKLKSQKQDIQIILAGFPKDKIELYKKSGVDEFIFLGADAMKILTSLHKILGGK